MIGKVTLVHKKFVIAFPNVGLSHVYCKLGYSFPPFLGLPWWALSFMISFQFYIFEEKEFAWDAILSK